MKQKKYFLILFLLIFPLFLSAIKNDLLIKEEKTSIPKANDYIFDGFPIQTMTNGTIHGGVYAGPGTYVGGAPTSPTSPGTSNYDIPEGTILWARLYVCVWGGTDTSQGKINTSVNGHNFDLVTIGGTEDSNPTYSQGTNAYGSGYGVWVLSYNVSSFIIPGVENNASAFEVPGGNLDGRLYCLFLVVVYEDPSMPLIDYWINEGAVSLNYVTPTDKTITYFNGLVDIDDIYYAEFRTTYLNGDGGNQNDSLYFNQVGDTTGGEHQLNGINVATGNDGWGFDFEIFNVTSLLSSSDNNASYYRDDESYLRPFCAILILEDKENVVPPTIDHPDDINYESGTTDNNITWHPDDNRPSSYQILKNGTNFENSPWDGSEIVVDIDGLDLGSYNFTCFVYDTSGNNVSDTVIVTVKDTTPPNIDSPLDIYYQKGTIGNNITWNPSDQNPANFTVYKNGIIYNQTDIWDGSKITVNIDGLEVGEYNFTCLVNDTSKNSNFDNVSVYISNDLTINHPQNISYVEGETGNTITWNPSSSSPQYYKIFKNNLLINFSSWDGSNIELKIDDLDVEIYNFTCWVNDTGSYSIQDDVFVNVTYDNTAPIITGPDDFTYEYNSIGNQIIWSASDINPTFYNITRNGELIGDAAVPWNGLDIILDIDGLTLGQYTYNCTLRDKNNNTASDYVTATVEDTTIPDISNLENIELESGTSIKINWTVSDLLPSNYTIMIDSEFNQSGSWTSETNITLLFYGLDLGLHWVKCIINDTSGNENSDDFTIEVIDTTIPIIIDEPIIEEIEEGDDETLIWRATDLHSGNFKIYCDNELIKSGEWQNNDEISISLKSFAEGTYTFTCKIFDTSNNYNESSITVEILGKGDNDKSDENKTIFGIPEYNFYLIIGGICLTSTISIVVLRKHFKSKVIR